jgi:hypothetical protein
MPSKNSRLTTLNHLVIMADMEGHLAWYVCFILLPSQNLVLLSSTNANSTLAQLCVCLWWGNWARLVGSRGQEVRLDSIMSRDGCDECLLCCTCGKTPPPRHS